MNELDLLRRFDEPDAPSPEARSAAEARLRARLERKRRRPVLVLALAGAAVAAVVVWILAAGGPAREETASASEVLERAAVVAARQPDHALGRGDFFYRRVRQTGQGGSGQTIETWLARSGAGRILATRHDPGQPDYESRHGPTRRGRLKDGSNAPPPVEPSLGVGRRLRYRELRALPTDPDALAARLREGAREIMEASGQPVTREAIDSTMFHIVGELLSGALPAPPSVRSALYLVAAELPGVRLLGERQDGAGRTGVAVEHVEDGAVALRIVFDPDSAELLSLEDQTVGEPQGGEQLFIEDGVVGSVDERP